MRKLKLEKFGKMFAFKCLLLHLQTFKISVPVFSVYVNLIVLNFLSVERANLNTFFYAQKLFHRIVILSTWLKYVLYLPIYLNCTFFIY